jgi:hypothetical protein
VPSDPYFMTGIEHKCLHVENQGERPVTVQIEIDFHGHGRFSGYESRSVGPAAAVTRTFPTGFSAHWVRLVSDTDTVASAQFFYT